MLQHAINDCTENVSSIEQCNPFKPYLQTPDVQNRCSRPDEVREPITGVLPALPGCNPIQNGPANATPRTCNK